MAGEEKPFVTVVRIGMQGVLFHARAIVQPERGKTGAGTYTGRTMARRPFGGGNGESTGRSVMNT